MKNLSQHAKGVSVVVCCYNSEERLPATLTHLAEQVSPANGNWEVVVVDNASTDKTSTVARETWSQQGEPVSLTVVDEPNPGLSSARRRGIEVSQFEFIIFVDDDNWLCREYVSRVFDILSGDGSIGVVGGHGEPVFESEPPAWFNRYAHYYAIGKQNDTPGEISGLSVCVYGAGMAIRKSAWLKATSAGFESVLSDRKGSSLASGGDHELCLVIGMAGYKVWYSPELKFKHFITERRLSWDYLMRLTENIHFSNVFLQPYYHLAEVQSGEQRSRETSSWLVNARRAGGRLFKSYRSHIKCRIRRGDTAESRRRLRKCIGEIKGWWTIRGKYPVLCREVNVLRSKLRKIDNEK